MVLTPQHVTSRLADDVYLFDCCQGASAWRHARNAGAGFLAPVPGEADGVLGARLFIFDGVRVANVPAWPASQRTRIWTGPHLVSKLNAPLLQGGCGQRACSEAAPQSHIELQPGIRLSSKASKTFTTAALCDAVQNPRYPTIE